MLLGQQQVLGIHLEWASASVGAKLASRLVTIALKLKSSYINIIDQHFQQTNTQTGM